MHNYADLGLVKRGLEFSRKKRKWIILLGLAGFSSYGVYKVYTLPSVEKKRRRLLKLWGAFLSVAELVSDSTETIKVLSNDLNEFLQSDSDEIPRSLKQLTKIARSDEFSTSLSRVTEAMTRGVLRAYNNEHHQGEIEEVRGSDFGDRVMDRLMSGAGTGFVSAVVGSFARNLVLGFYANGEALDALKGDGDDGTTCVKSNSTSMDGWVQLLCDDNCRVLIADCIKTFVSTAVAVYLDKTMNINFYDEMFSGLTNPKHQGKVSDILVSLCNGAVETLVKTSHQVLTSTKDESGSNKIAPYSAVNQAEFSGLLNEKDFDQGVISRKVRETGGCIDLQRNGWVSSVSSTLAVPSNRRFVLDMTSRVTFESIRSLVEFFYWKISEGLKGSISAVREDATERGREIIRYVGAKSAVILTICLALLLHLLGGTRALLPA